MLRDSITTFLEERKAARYSPHTIRCYKVTFEKLVAQLGNIPIERIRRDDIICFLNSQSGISAKTLRNYHADLSALWSWSVARGQCDENIVRTIRAPIAEKPEILPISKVELLALLDTARQSDLLTSMRNEAIILLLVDSGIRASELCALKIKDFNRITSHILVFGKGKKTRNIPISPITLEKIITYIESRPGKSKYLFTTKDNQPISRIHLGNILERLAQRARINHVYPHRFRHTFAIQFLRNGGNIYSLQKILGHTTLDMVKRYLAISQVDIDNDHAAASPVKHWLS